MPAAIAAIVQKTPDRNTQIQDVQRAVQTALERLWYPPPEDIADAFRHGHVHGIMRVQVQNRLNDARALSSASVIELVDAWRNHASSIDQFNKQIETAERTPLYIEEKRHRIETLNGEIESLHGQRIALTNKLVSRREELEQKRKERARLTAHLDKSQTPVRLAARADQVAQMLGELIIDAWPLQSAAIAKAMTSAIQEMAHRNAYFHKVSITPDGDVALHSPDGRNLRNHDLSAGEKQIFTQALFSAVAEVSGCMFPLVVDTPLERLDKEHRRNVLRHIAHRRGQVILISTNTEVVGDHLLGFGAFNIPSRLAIARSLAVARPPEPVTDESGRTISGNILFGSGAELASWVCLVVEYSQKTLSLKELQDQVQRHWVRGLQLLKQDVDASGGDEGMFWRKLAEECLPKTAMSALDTHAAIGHIGSTGPVTVRLGEIGVDTASGQVLHWTINGTGGSPHSAFMGGVGSGKTRTAAFMLRAIAEQAQVPFLAFDFKGDLTDRYNALDRAFAATVISPPDIPIPLDVFALGDTSPHAVAMTAQRLRDSLGNLKQSRLGVQQQRRLGDALETGLRTFHPCTLYTLRECLNEVYATENAKEDGATSMLRDLCRLPPFEPTLSPTEFFSRSWIVSLPASLPELVRVNVVVLLTDALERHINAQPDSATDTDGNRSLRLVCLIDEAHRILSTRLPGLENLIRQGRSKGAAVMLISQKPDDFDGKDEEFLDEMGLLACFATNAKDAAVKRIMGAGTSLAQLKQGEAWMKQRGEKTRKVKAWE